MLRLLLTLTFLVVVYATYYPWQPWQGNTWTVSERSGEDIYPGIYLGDGTSMWHRGAAEMSCTLNTFQGYIVSNVVWTKIRGNYEEPFYPCPYCHYVDDRIKAYNHMGKSILIIRDPTPMDEGIYRCTATAQYHDGRLTTIYQIVHLL